MGKTDGLFSVYHFDFVWLEALSVAYAHALPISWDSKCQAYLLDADFDTRVIPLLEREPCKEFIVDPEDKDLVDVNAVMYHVLFFMSLADVDKVNRLNYAFAGRVKAMGAFLFLQHFVGAARYMQLRDMFQRKRGRLPGDLIQQEVNLGTYRYCTRSRLREVQHVVLGVIRSLFYYSTLCIGIPAIGRTLGKAHRLLRVFIILCVIIN